MIFQSFKFTFFISLLLILMNAVSSGQQPDERGGSGNSILWNDPGEVEKLDFTAGQGGRENAPQPPFAFIEETLSGTDPRVRVIDAKGARWSVRFGPEVNAETFATRIAWACGYFVEPVYFIPSGNIDDLGKLDRAKKHIDSNGNFKNARFERQREKGIKYLEESDSWSWIQNPFTGSMELKGLKVIMMLVSNRDNKDVRDVKGGSQTAIYQYPRRGETTEDRYLVNDWGGSMGKWGSDMNRKKWDCRGYAQQTPKFVMGIRGDYFVWGYSGYHTTDLTDGITISDVRWLLRTLGRITDAQLKDGLKASGASTEEINCFARAVRERINQLKECVGE